MKSESTKIMSRTFESERKGLLSFIRSKIRSLEESEDLLQDVYLQALHNLNVLESVDNLTGWLYTVAKNKIIDWYRKKRLPTVPIDVPDENGITFEGIIADNKMEKWDEETRQLVYEAIIESIEELPAKQKYVFIQQVIEGRTFRELAEETGESINTLIARKRYALHFLQDRLREIKHLINE